MEQTGEEEMPVNKQLAKHKSISKTLVTYVTRKFLFIKVICL